MRIEFIPKGNPLEEIYLANSQVLDKIRSTREMYDLICIYESFLDDQAEEITALSLIEPRLSVIESKLVDLQGSVWKCGDCDNIKRAQLAYRNIRYFRGSVTRRLRDLRNLPREKRQEHERTWYPMLPKAE